MNPEIDLKSFQRGNPDDPGRTTGELVSPPRRLLTRFALPVFLFAAFIGVFAYAAKDALSPVVEVRIVQPVIPSGGISVNPAEGNGPAGATPGVVAESATSQPAAIGGEPLFQAPGWVEPDPFTTLVSSLIAGTLSEVYVREGENVPAGAVVAELDSTDAHIALQKAEANLAVRRAELEAAQQNWDYPIEVEQTLRTAQAEKARLEAEKLKLQRQYQFQFKLAGISRELGKTGADSALAAEKATMEANVAEATVKEIEAKSLAQDAILDAATSTAQLRIEDKSRLALARAQLQEAEAAVREASVALDRCKVVAPTTGTVMRLHKTPGAMVSADVPEGTQIVSMYDPQSLQVRAEVPLAEAGKIQIGLSAEIKVEAMPDKVFKGELTRIVHQADVQRNSLQVKVRILNPVPTLKPEMVARVQFLTSSKPVDVAATTESKEQSAPKPPGRSGQAGSAQELLLIPSSLLPSDAKGEATLWLVGPDMRAFQKAVTLGAARAGGLREVTRNLQPSDKIIASNTEKLKVGSRLRIAGAPTGKSKK